MELFAFGALKAWPKTIAIFIQENGQTCSFWEEDMWQNILEIQPALKCLTVEERLHIPGFEIAKQELITEHNMMPEMHTTTSAVAQVQWLHTQYLKHMSEVILHTVIYCMH